MTAQLLKVDYRASPTLSICLSPSNLSTNGATAKSGLHVKADKVVETCQRAKPCAMARPLRLKRKQGDSALRDRRERMPFTFFGSSRVCYLIDVVDEFGAATSIDTIDGVSVDGDKRVYNLNGQIVGTGASKLGKGMYVTNGKKFIVK